MTDNVLEGMSTSLSVPLGYVLLITPLGYGSPDPNPPLAINIPPSTNNTLLTPLE